MIYIFVIFCLVVLLSSTTFAFKLQHNPRRLITKLNGGADKHSSLWDNHSPVQDIPETLVKAIDGNAVMRQKFEKLCRNAQVFTLLFGQWLAHLIGS
jgi:acyl-CoA synthetase (NDP forming)